jgi:hypothetical protein
LLEACFLVQLAFSLESLDHCKFELALKLVNMVHFCKCVQDDMSLAISTVLCQFLFDKGLCWFYLFDLNGGVEEGSAFVFWIEFVCKFNCWMKCIDLYHKFYKFFLWSLQKIRTSSINLL